MSARTESSFKKRNQAVPRTFSKRRSRFSSLWGLDTVSKRKSSGHPSISQVQWQRRSSVQTQCVTPTSATHSALPSVCVRVCVLLLQVFVDGKEPMKKPLERMFEDSASEKSVSRCTRPEDLRSSREGEQGELIKGAGEPASTHFSCFLSRLFGLPSATDSRKRCCRPDRFSQAKH